MRRLKRDYPDHRIFIGIEAGTEEDWTKMAAYGEQAGVDGIEINLSCPHMGRDNVGMDAGTKPEVVTSYVKATLKGTKLPIFAKMTPNQSTMLPAAIAAMKAGASGISAINTVKAITDLDHDHYTTLPIINGKSAASGLSGAAVKPISMRFTQEMASCPELKGTPISAIGGIYTWKDAVDFMLLGARTVQCTTSVMEYGYRIVKDMASGMMHFMEEKGYNSVDDFIGLAVNNIVSTLEFDRTYIVRPNFDQEKCVGCGRCYVSCFDGGHQAIKWIGDKRRPELDTDHCVGCHLCLNICPVKDCITPGEIAWRKDCEPKELKLRAYYE
jgi:dihydropyrimidine dehydrogenase (NAD+) subunit PreA